MNKQFVDSIRNDEAEKSGLLNLLLDNAKNIVNNDGFTYEYDLKYIIELWESNSSSIARFGQECLVQDSKGTISKKNLFGIYVNFCTKNKLTILPSNVFHPTIKEKFQVIESWKNEKGQRERYYSGLAWNPSNDWVKSVGLVQSQSILS